MFTQMCDAVATCHERTVFHRDIKPENFIVTDAFVNGERRVVVKLSDFGLSTTDEDCADMDCGSAPYMSFECRNNLAPTYKPAAADVWSLGIVLINMCVVSDFPCLLTHAKPGCTIATPGLTPPKASAHLSPASGRRALTFSCTASLA